MFGWWSSGEKSKSEAQVGKDGVEKNIEKTADGSESEKGEGKDATETAKELAKNFGSFLYSVANAATKTAVKVKDTVKDTVEGKSDILTDFNKEQEKFVNEKHNKRKETGVPPWVGYHEEEIMKSQILALSSDERNFLRDPPSGVQFHYDYEGMFPVAVATLEEDPQLKSMRFKLVPKKVKEETFWRNYFYRVSLIKQSSQLTSLAAATGNTSATAENQKTNNQSTAQPIENADQKAQFKKKEANSRTENLSEEMSEMTLSSSPPQDEFISDAFEGAHELSKEDLEQIGVERSSERTQNKNVTTRTDPVLNNETSSSNEVKTNETAQASIPDWERELQEELQGYDVVTEGGEGDDDDDGSWEKEIEDLLEAEDS